MNLQKFPALRSHDFKLLWIGQLVSTMGSQMQIVAINWHIYLLTHSAVALGLIGLMRFIPLIFCSLIAGVVADRYNRKKLELVLQIILGILSGSLAIATLTNHVSSLMIYAVTLLSMTAVAFELPTRQAMIPSLVKKEDLDNAMSLNVIMRETATILGPAAAGFLIAWVNVGPIYLINALSFGAVVISLLLMRFSGEVKGEAVEITWAAVKEGVAFVRSKTIIWSTMLLDFLSTFFAGATTLMPIFATDILHVGPRGLGLLYSAPSVGAVVAGIFIAQNGGIKKKGKILLLAVFLYGIATLVFGASKIYTLSILALFVVGAGDSVSTIIRNTIRQTVTPDHLRGRMVAINMIFFAGGPQLGEFEAGLVAAALGAPASVMLGGAGVLAVILFMSLVIPTLREYDK